MELGRPLTTVTPTLDGDVLTVLARQQGRFTTGDVHRILPRFSEEGIRKVLQRLTRQGVVHAERVGHAYSYRLNTAHLAAGPIIELANMQGTLLTRVQERLARWAFPPVYAAVFGSAARGAMTPDSDVDLFLVLADDTPREVWDEQVAALAEDLTAWTGNDARPLEYAVSDLTDQEPVLRDVLDEGLTVAGSRAWLARHLRPGGGLT
jgi:predicted nucleotidyltransferase